jgi:hypothetical protein
MKETSQMIALKIPRSYRFPLVTGLALSFLLCGLPAYTIAGGIGVDISPYVNNNIQTYTNGSNYPSGGTVLTNDGISFTLAYYTAMSGTGVIQTDQSSYTVATDIQGASTVYTLINSAYGAFGDTVGSVKFVATGGLEYTVDLVEGQNIRDHNQDGFNNTIGEGSLGYMYIHTFGFGPVRLDEQEFVLPTAFQTATLTEIIISGTGTGFDGSPFLAAATVSTVPEPSSAVLLGMAATVVIGFSLRFKRCCR